MVPAPNPALTGGRQPPLRSGRANPRTAPDGRRTSVRPPPV